MYIFGVNYLATIVTAVIAFIASMIWYMSFGGKMAKLNPKAYGKMKPEPVKMLGEIIRNIILTLVLTFFVLQLGTSTWMEAVIITLLLWIGFPVLLLSGSVIYEGVSWKLALIHAGDWFIKILLIVSILSMWY
jgi:hypothetical protein